MEHVIKRKGFQLRSIVRDYKYTLKYETFARRIFTILGFFSFVFLQIREFSEPQNIWFNSIHQS